MVSGPESTPEQPRLHEVGTGGRPRIRISTDPDAIRVLIAELNARVIPDTYVTGGAPVHVQAVTGTASPAAIDRDAPLPLTATVLRPAGLARLLAEYTEIIQLVAERGAIRSEEVSPARGVLASVLDKQTWPGLPVLHRIISTPVLRPNGTLLQTPGYDPATSLLLASNHHLDPVPEAPSPEQVRAAREFLLGQFLRDFPWRGPADKANYLGLLVTPIIRPYTRALSPFAVIEATMPGSGKSILTGCVGLLVGQKVLGWAETDKELRLQITSVLADQVGVVVWDNLEEGTEIKSPVLARLLTEHTWTDRLLTTNTAATYANDRLWLATGNAVHIGGDMASRTVWVRLDPDCPHPEARTGFAIDQLDTWILQPANQARVLWHLLVLVLDWTNAGAPLALDVPAMRQFTRWAQQVGGFLEHHGVLGFLSNLDDSRELDADTEEWRAFLLHWHHIHGQARLTAKQLLDSGPAWDSTLDPWEGTFPTPTGKKPAMSLGKRLAGRADRWHRDIRLRSVWDDSRNMRVFWVERDPATGQPPEQSPGSPEVRQHAPDQEQQW